MLSCTTVRPPLLALSLSLSLFLPFSFSRAPAPSLSLSLSLSFPFSARFSRFFLDPRVSCPFSSWSFASLPARLLVFPSIRTSRDLLANVSPSRAPYTETPCDATPFLFLSSSLSVSHTLDFALILSLPSSLYLSFTSTLSLSVCLYPSLPLCLSFSVCLSVCLSVSLPLSLSLSLSVSLSLSISSSFSTSSSFSRFSQSIYLSVARSSCLFLSFYQCRFLSLFLSLTLSLSLSLSLYLPLSLPVSLFVCYSLFGVEPQFGVNRLVDFRTVSARYRRGVSREFESTCGPNVSDHLAGTPHSGCSLAVQLPDLRFH